MDGLGAILEDRGDEPHEIKARTGLSAFMYLEFLDASFSFDGVIGAFYAITALGMIMFLQSFLHIPEVFTGLIGAAFIGVAFIGVAFVASVRHNRRQVGSVR